MRPARTSKQHNAKVKNHDQRLNSCFQNVACTSPRAYKRGKYSHATISAHQSCFSTRLIMHTHTSGLCPRSSIMRLAIGPSARGTSTNCGWVKSDPNVGVPPLPSPHPKSSARTGPREARREANVGIRAEGVQDRDPEIVQGGAVREVEI